MQPFLIAQFTGSIAVILSLIMYQFNNRRYMLVIDIAGGVFWVLTFLGLHALSGATIVALGILINLAFLFILPSRKNLWLLLLAIGATITATILTWGGSVSLLAMCGSILYTIRFWATNTTVIRRLSLIAPPFWFAYDVLTGNYPGAFLEIFGVASNIIAQYRFDFAKSREV